LSFAHAGESHGVRAPLARLSRGRGYTLIEIMIVVAVIAILASVALPAYNNTLVRSNRAAAQSYLLDLANREELYLLDARTYTTSVSTLLSVPAGVSPYYTVTISVPSETTIANAYKITAAPITTSMQRNDGTLTIDQDGVKSGTW
jgi:type IV pilus assembly protein PilE